MQPQPPVRHEHRGVYGAWLQDARLVTVRKARCPYTGWLDLPGGSPEPGESVEQTLRRELHEECGVRVASIHSWHPFRFTVDTASDGSPIDFHHRGQIAVVDVIDRVSAIEDVEDVSSVVLLAQVEAVPVTPLVDRARRLLGW